MNPPGVGDGRRLQCRLGYRQERYRQERCRQGTALQGTAIHRQIAALQA